MTFEMLLGSAGERLASVAARSVQCVVTSPPYWGLRDYGTATWEGGDPACPHFKLAGGTGAQGLGKSAAAMAANVVRSSVPFRDRCGLCGAVRVDAQLGLEDTPEAYVEALVEVFREVRRVLRDDGVVFVNLGDSYYSGGGSRSGCTDTLTGQGRRREAELDASRRVPMGAKAKDLVGIPWMVAFALRADGWYLRSDIIWVKPSCMPESVTDRPTKAHEYVFLLTKSSSYHYDADAIRETVDLVQPPRRFGRKEYEAAQEADGYAGARAIALENGQGTATNMGNHYGRVFGGHGERNARSVWTINTEPSPFEHFAVMPRALARRCILAGTSAWGQCPTCGAPWSRVVATGAPDAAHRAACGANADGTYTGTARKDYDGAGVQDPSAVKARILAGMVQKQTVGWEPSCDCPEAEPIPQTVLDPFAGVATTGVVALEEGRSFIGIELSPKYYALGEARLRMVSPLLATSASAAIPSAAQPSLFGDDDANAPRDT